MYRNINNNYLTEKLTQHIADEFDKLRDKFGLTYEKDFNSFSLGYTMAILGSIKR